MKLDYFVSRWGRIALHFLVFSAIAGVGLRYYNFSMIETVNYKFLLHTHSHVALLGWMFLAFSAAMVKGFLPEKISLFHRILLLTLVSVLGMMVSFPFQGYAAISITFSILFLFASYWFVYAFLKGLKEAIDKSLSAKFIRWSLFFLVISSIGPWALGPIMVFGESHGILYNLSIYFYLHFLYNGFFVLALFGIIMRKLENDGIEYSASRGLLFYRLTVYSIIPAFALSMLWTNPPIWVYIIGGLAGLAPLLGLIIGWPIMKIYIIGVKSRFYRALTLVMLLVFSLKLIMQFLSAIPSLADYAYESRVFTVIGYIHLVMLGFFTLFILIYFIVDETYKDHVMSRIGIVVFIIGFAFSEIILFSNGLVLSVQGSMINNYALLIFSSSILMPLGFVILWLLQLRRKTSGFTV